MQGSDATPWFVALALALGVLGYGGWWFMRPRASSAVVAQIEQHVATEGTVMFVRPALVAFGPLTPGARQYLVDIATPLGFSRTDTVEVDQTGHVRTILVGTR